MKNIPNVISGLRIAGSLALLFVTPLSTPFFILYFICGVSDMLDGMLARKLKCTSALGATLDGIGDLTLCFVLLVKLLPILPLSFETLAWIGAIALIRFISFAIGYAKYSSFAALHTYANKATGFMLFAFPVLYIIFGLSVTTTIICTVATLSAVEEVMITITSTQLDRNVKSIFRPNKSNL